MLTTIIFGLFVVLLWATAEPMIALRKVLSKKIRTCNPKSYRNWIVRALNCVPCSSFYIGLILYYMYPYIPLILVYAVYLSGTTMLLSILKSKYYDEGTFN